LKRRPLDYASKGDKEPLAAPARRAPRMPVGVEFTFALAVAFIGASGSVGLLAYRLCTDGVIAILWMLSATGVGWGIARRLPGTRLLRTVTAAALGLGVISLVALALGLGGWLNLAVAWLLLGAGWGLGAMWVVLHYKGAAPNLASGDSSPRSPWRHLIWLAMPFLGLSILAATVPPGPLWQDEPAGYDVSEYHLQVPREWYQAGRITPLQHNVFSYMPMNVEVHDLLAMHLRGGPWAGMYLAQYMHVGWMALAVLAAAGVAGAISDVPWAAPLAGATMAVVPWVTLLAPIAYNEAGLMLYGTLAIGWAMIASRKREWLVAGAFGGLACGVKLTAAPMVVVAVLVAAVVTRFAPARCDSDKGERNAVGPLEGSLLFLVASLVTFAPWLIRNQVWAGNPIFPEGMAVLGKAHFADVQVERWHRAHSPVEGDRPVVRRVVAAWERIGADWRYGFVLLPAGVAALAWRRDRAAAFLGIVLGVQLFVWLAFTHLQGRFYILSIPIAAIAIGSLRVRDWAFAGLAAAVVMACVNLYHAKPRFVKFVLPVSHESSLGIEDLRWLTYARTNVDLDTVPPDKTIVLAGDAEAFSYSQMPMSRLRYRTVFDVPPAKAGDWLAAWTGGAGGLVIVTPADLRRFKATYFDVPSPSFEELDKTPGPYTIQR
jgi:hypothetical protein